MKKYILFFAAAFAAFTVKAQSGYNYQELGIGVDASYIRGYTNVQRQYYHPAFSFNLIYNYNPYVPVTLEYQMGTLSGGGLTVALDKYRRQYSNNYKAFLLHTDVQLGSVIDYGDDNILNILKNFYIGTGIGVVSNSNTVQRYSLDAPPPPDPLAYKFPGSDKSIDFMFPIRFGYEFRIWDSYNEPSMAIDIGYIHNFAFGEGLDGYNDPNSKFKNNAVDQYSQIVIGFKYYFGTVVSYNKLIRTFR